MTKQAETSAPQHQAGMQGFRTDIQLWRCLAVIAVVVFHIDPHLLPGGYLGVDVFFVVSGFLMTGQIVGRIENNTWSMRSFIWRRIKRLFPALYVTILLTLVATYLFASPDRVVSISQSSLAAAFAFSNILFWQTIDYFDTSSALDPLLHTWSLGVEEQFYLLWPLILMAVAALARSIYAKIAFTVLLFAASLAAAEWMVHRDANAAFYLLPFRVFEFCIGAFAAFAVRRFGQIPRFGVLIFAGCLAVTTSTFFIFDEASPVPGVLALWPLLPVGLSLMFFTPISGAMGTVVAPFKAIGDFSYSLYLVHWPVIIFWADLVPYDLPVMAEYSAQLVACIVAGYLLYTLVETPLRGSKSSTGSKRNVLAASSVIALLVAISSSTTYAIQRDGFFSDPTEHTENVLAAMEKIPAQYALGTCFFEDAEVNLLRYDENGCLSPSGDNPHILLFGDSAAAQFSRSLRTMAEERGWRFSQITKSSCPPLLEMPRQADCKEHNQLAVELIARRDDIDVIILAGNYFNHRNTRVWVGRTIEALGASNARIVQMGPQMRFDDAVPRLLSEYSTSPVRVSPDIYDHVHDGVFQHAEDFADELVTMQPAYFELPSNFEYVEMVSMLCEAETDCRFFVDGTSVFRDQFHLTPEGSQWILEQLDDTLFELRAE